MQFQNILSLGVGTILIVMGITGISGIKVPIITKMLGRLQVLLKGLFTTFLAKKNLASVFLLGSLNGLLPCGLTFLALTSCLTAQHPVDGFVFMIFFGAGTLPAMLGFAGMIQWIVRRFQVSWSRLNTTVLILSGLLLILRVFLVHIPTAHTATESFSDIVICR